MNNIFIQIFLKLYKLIWILALPFLKKHSRLKDDFEKRLSSYYFEPADVWIQAASAGEAYLAVAIVRKLKPELKIKILITTITEQGRKILLSNLDPERISSEIDLKIQYFPFDIPQSIQKVIAVIQPKLMILLEMEIWPSILYYLKANKTKIMIANARMSAKSLRLYRLTRFLWKKLAPDKILSVYEQDGIRFHKIFGITDIKIMPNIKFEISAGETFLLSCCHNHISKYLPSGLPLTILASVNEQEEKQVLLLLKEVIQNFPDQVVGIFPRHMNRIKIWERQLSKYKLKYRLRSVFDSKSSSPVRCPCIILWDVFGELKTAYEFASVVFVGGSLKPSGGQNMLEPLMFGVPTIIGPYYEDFAWAADDMIRKELLIRKNSWKQVAKSIVKHLNNPVSRDELQQKVHQHIQSMQGGTTMVCNEILKILRYLPK